jgi:histidinol-phosphate aminotransferase
MNVASSSVIAQPLVSSATASPLVERAAARFRIEEDVMSLSRRGFFRSVGVRGHGPVSGAAIAARGREAMIGDNLPYGSPAQAGSPDVIKISSNENPLGPGAAALAAMTAQFPQGGRYAFNSKPGMGDFVGTIAKKWNVKAENVTVGAGSGELLRNAVRAFTSASRPLVTGACSYESPFRTAEQIGTPVKYVKMTADLKLDLDAMAAEAAGAGLMFVCNPNNPTATAHPLNLITDFVGKVRRVSPDTAILIDEAYADYATDPGYKTAIPLAMETPNVFVCRTFSKAYGMAGLRLGYAVGRAEVVKDLARWGMTPFNLNTLGVAAAVTSLNDQPHIDRERARNTEVRAFTVKALADMGYKPTDTQTNFIFVDIRRPAKEFRDACAAQGVLVGRDFPPYEKTHARISIGTMDEMRRAVEVFRKVLGSSATTAAAR